MAESKKKTLRTLHFLFLIHARIKRYGSPRKMKETFKNISQNIAEGNEESEKKRKSKYA